MIFIYHEDRQTLTNILNINKYCIILYYNQPNLNYS